MIRLIDALITMNDMIKKSNDYPEEYVEEYNYGYVKYVIDVMKKSGRIETEVYGMIEEQRVKSDSKETVDINKFVITS